jgi:hypothetical protein
MSADHFPPSKRRVVIRITARDKADPAALLAAVRNALSGYGICIEVRTVAQEESAPEIPTRSQVIKDEVQETALRALLKALLDEVAAEKEKERAAHVRDAERYVAEIVAQRAGLRAYVSYWAGQGVRIAVEKLLGPIAAVVSRALGGESAKSN